ncbi:MAG: tetratricopeptide repeat protein [Imperialibacter sp.]|uniref:Tetratricopeptide repeat protein n=1 Tax=Imperialibacter roseus TaxID=1324217 RepID=A0ABZ0IJ04_9BACT|nr:hypothetical protein [Imperialibacter roseus]WOK05013.1 hypothetical protein RT717_18185 [Imperialibacter roseus]|tara:strand:- start:1106 stop:2869 length:1764 start_codon:yes stop_codon:yes gene_type:complete
MKKTRLAFGILFGSLLMSGCALNKMIKLANDQQLEVTPNPLELHADKVEFEMSAILPPKMLPGGTSYSLKTFYQYGTNEAELGTVEFKAGDFPNSSSTTSRKSQTFSFAYDPAMAKGDVMIQGVAAKGAKNKTTEKMKVAEGVITTSLMVEDIVAASYADHGYNDKEELEPTNVEFFFEQGRSVLRTSEKNSDRGKGFTAFVADKNVTRTVTITGTHSPEGTETINSDLSQDRAEAIEKWYRDMMAKYDYKGMADQIKFVLKPVVQDWTQFKTMLNGFDGVSSDEKTAMLAVVNGTGTFEEKEKALQKLSGYKKVFDKIYPVLRTAKTEVLTVKVKRPNPEIAVLAKQIGEGSISADSLSNAELLFGATLTPSLTEKEAIYKAAIKKQDTWVAHNNLGAVYLQMAAAASGADVKKNVDLALTQLEIANKQKANTAEVLVNMATVYMLQGDNTKAYDVAGTVSGATGDALRKLNTLKGTLEVKTAQYDKALMSFAGADNTAEVSFNRGLALVLKKEFSNAKTAFKDATDKDSSYAKAFYGLAIVGARTSNATEVTNGLKSAIAEDSSLKEKALTDLEFRNYADAVRSL